MCETCGYHGCIHDQVDEWDADPCLNCGPHCAAWGGDGLCDYEIQSMADEQDEIEQEANTQMARALRLAVIQNQFDAGNLNEDQARDLLSRPLTPGGDNIFDDSDQLRVRCS